MRDRSHQHSTRIAYLCFTTLLFVGHVCAAQPPKYILAHYMPWFSTKPYSGSWGWHWTMNHYNPDQMSGQRRSAASHYYPKAGLYDSSDPDTLKCQVMLMKLAGIDGVIVDWYGTDNYYDYATNNKNTLLLLSIIKQAGLHFAICYEDQTVKTEIAGGVFPASAAIDHGQKLMAWMNSNLFSSPAYLKVDGHPVLLTFGNPYYQDAQWQQIFSVLAAKPLYYTEENLLCATSAAGAFDWPQPQGGTQADLDQQSDFYKRSAKWSSFIAAAYPRFNDIYKDAGVGPGYGGVDDNDGATYHDTLEKALQSKAFAVQLVTWNDWGEGTQIEPSIEFGERDLITTQELRRKYIDHAFPYQESDLSLPMLWLELRKTYAGNSVIESKLTEIYSFIIMGKIKEARTLLHKGLLPNE